MLNRREFIRTGAIAAGTLSFNPAFLRGAFARQAKPGPSPYGALGAPDANGLRLPSGFTSRLIARGNELVSGTSYVLPAFPDGTGIYPQADGGWIMAVNSEHPLPGLGGASAMRFDRSGNVTAAYRILDGTQMNCSGGTTPWNTWLSCEEHDQGHTWDCDIFGAKPAVQLPALGKFKHEAARVDPIGKRVYQTEDQPDGGFYRFTPAAYPDLSKGLLEVAIVDENGLVEWARVPDPGATSAPTRQQVKGMTQFKRGEGLFVDHPFVYITTTGDSQIHAYNVITETIEVLWSGNAIKENSPLIDVDQLTKNQGGEIFVCEDEGELRISLLTADGSRVAPFLQLDGEQHRASPPPFGNEITGIVFDPSGTRMYFSAQRTYGPGALYEITGPFRRKRVDLREPTLRVEAPAKARFGRVAGGGLEITLLGDEACTVTAALRIPGARPATVARGRTTLKRGRNKRLTLKAGDRAAALLRKRRRAAKAKLVVKAVDGRGNKRTVTRDVALSRR